MGEEEATNVTAGIWGFLILFLLAMACWVLYRSMNRHLRNVRLQNEANVREQQDGEGVRAQQHDVDPDAPASADAGRTHPEGSSD